MPIPCHPVFFWRFASSFWGWQRLSSYPEAPGKFPGAIDGGILNVLIGTSLKAPGQLLTWDSTLPEIWQIPSKWKRPPCGLGRGARNEKTQKILSCVLPYAIDCLQLCSLPCPGPRDAIPPTLPQGPPALGSQPSNPGVLLMPQGIQSLFGACGPPLPSSPLCNSPPLIPHFVMHPLSPFLGSL